MRLHGALQPAASSTSRGLGARVSILKQLGKQLGDLTGICARSGASRGKTCSGMVSHTHVGFSGVSWGTRCLFSVFSHAARVGLSQLLQEELGAGPAPVLQLAS